MARPKAFDRDRTLARALELFQAKGYEATSIQDLVDAMGIGRQSLYDTFGDKEALYREALERYVAEGPRSVLVALESPLPTVIPAEAEVLAAVPPPELTGGIPARQ